MLFRRRGGGISEGEMMAAIKSAASDAAVATTLSNHIESCAANNARVDAALAKQDADRAAMHAENQQRFSRLERIIYIATGIATALSWLLRSH